MGVPRVPPGQILCTVHALMSNLFRDRIVMATATMATAAGAAALLYYTLNRVERISHRLIQAPATWVETISTLSETLRFTYSETLGKWPIGDLAFGINFLLKRQGQLHVGSVFGGKDSLRLEGGPDKTVELRCHLKLLTLCWHFSKKPFPVFLKETGYSAENVLLQEPKAGILKPAFTILVDHSMKCFILVIRGTHSIKDTLTAATGAVVPFHHSVVYEGGVSNLVLGYAHCGMVAAARWIAKLATPCLIKALGEYPGYKIQIVGHSLGGGTAALLTYILRERKELSTTTCVSFGPAACMTWELAESGINFVTSVINGADLVPTFSAASVDDLRAEVTASAWLNDLRNQIEHTRILSTVYRSASALGSRLPSIASARAKVAGAGAILRPVSNGTQVVMKRAQSMAQAAWTRPALGVSSWSCMGPRRRATAAHTKEEESSLESSAANAETSEHLLSSPNKTATTTVIEGPDANGDADVNDVEDLISHNSHEDRMTEVELWQQLEHELYDRTEGEEADVAKEIREEEAAAIAEVGEDQPESSTQERKEAHRFFPAGKIMHIITFYSDGAGSGSDGSPTTSGLDNGQLEDTTVGIFLTPRSLYSKLRLSQTMISDHFMPVYRRQIERLIKDFETEKGVDDHKTGEVVL
nr:sn1-specific diacylglycerol lipase alpha [Quercus suber]